MDHETSLLGTLEEISRLVVSSTGNAAETLKNIARLLQQRFTSDVCSVYLMEADRRHLVLSATVGLEPSSVGRVRMRLDEGLVGLVGQELRPVVIADATSHPRFKYFPEAGESRYLSFLGVPIIDRGLLIGVVVVQTTDARRFSAAEVLVVSTAASQLTPLVSDARMAWEQHLQQERLRVVHLTIRTVQDIVNNCLNQMQLVRFEAEEHLAPATLAAFDEAVHGTAAKLTALGNLERFVERPMAIGTGLHWEDEATAGSPV